jgi:hypothetical protein
MLGLAELCSCRTCILILVVHSCTTQYVSCIIFKVRRHCSTCLFFMLVSSYTISFIVNRKQNYTCSLIFYTILVHDFLHRDQREALHSNSMSFPSCQQHIFYTARELFSVAWVSSTSYFTSIFSNKRNQFFSGIFGLVTLIHMRW